MPDPVGQRGSSQQKNPLVAFTVTHYAVMDPETGIQYSGVLTEDEARAAFKQLKKANPGLEKLTIIDVEQVRTAFLDPTGALTGERYSPVENGG